MPTPDLERIARCCHEANRALCESFGDDSQPPWDQAADWQRDATYDMVRWCLDNPHADATALHASWMAHKIAAGWKWGETKDDDALTHPALVPFEQLPALEKAKDAVFVALIRGWKNPE